MLLSRVKGRDEVIRSSTHSLTHPCFHHGSRACACVRGRLQTAESSSLLQNGELHAAAVSPSTVTRGKDGTRTNFIRATT